MNTYSALQEKIHPENQDKSLWLGACKIWEMCSDKKHYLHTFHTNPSWQQDWEGMGVPWALYHAAT